MQCPSCRFENMPGLESCGRCGSVLNLASVALDVNPPRATPWQKVLRRWLPWSSFYRARDLAQGRAAATTEALDEAGIALPEWPEFSRMVVPGWAHFYRGHKAQGWFFLGAFLLLLLLTVLWWGTVPGAIVFGLLISIHASSCIDLLFSAPGTWGTKAHAAIVVLVVLGLAIYLPLGWLATRVAMPLTVQFDTPLFQTWDVLLVNRMATPQVGNVVLYYPVPIQVPGVNLGQGQWIDRIVAGPGNQVVWKDGQLFVDGQPSPWEPLDRQRMPGRLDLGKVPAGHYVIFPTTVRLGGNNAAALDRTVRDTSLVPFDRVQGQVYFRNQPLARMGVIR